VRAGPDGAIRMKNVMTMMVAITARMARNSFRMARIPADYICRDCIKGWPVKKFLRKQFLSE
jgi:hypothetical protein